MNIAIDANGYAYDVDTGNYVTVIYDDQGNAYDAASGEKINEVITDNSGATVYTSSPGVDWNAIINTAAQAYAANQGAAQSGQYIPATGARPVGSPIRASNQSALNVSGGINPAGAGGSVSISTNTIMLIAGGVLLFILGSQKGRR
jgi:hypothetical protein